MTAITGDLSRQPESVDTRRHDLDALRAFAMLLGIASACRHVILRGPLGCARSIPRVTEYAFFVSAIHGFRMPLFFPA